MTTRVQSVQCAKKAAGPYETTENLTLCDVFSQFILIDVLYFSVILNPKWSL